MLQAIYEDLKDRFRGRHYVRSARRRFPVAGLPNVCFVAVTPNACSDLVVEPLDTLHQQGLINLCVLFELRSSAHLLMHTAVKADIVVLFRPPGIAMHRVAVAAREAGAIVVICTDDDLLALEPDHAAGKSVTLETKERMRELYLAVQALWVFSPSLAERYRCFGKPCLQLKTLVTRPPLPEPTRRGVFHIGHIGDWSHADEMQPLVEMVGRLDRERLQKTWRMVFVGYTPSELRSHPSVRSIPYIKGTNRFLAWLKRQRWDIGVAPLRDTPFNRAKTDNKFRTFAAFGVAGVYADVAPYTSTVEHDRTGLVVPHDGRAYADAVRMLLLDEAKRLAIRDAAHAHIGRIYAEAIVLEGWLQAIRDALAFNSPALCS